RLVAHARFVDRDTRAAPAADTQAPPAPSASSSLPWRPRRFMTLLLVLGMLCVGGVIAARVVGFREGVPAAHEGARWQVDQRRSITSDPGAELLPRISPDGTRVAYSVGEGTHAGSRVVVRGTDQSRERRLTMDDSGEERYPV